MKPSFFGSNGSNGFGYALRRPVDRGATYHSSNAGKYAETVGNTHRSNIIFLIRSSRPLILYITALRFKFETGASKVKKMDSYCYNTIINRFLDDAGSVRELYQFILEAWQLEGPISLITHPQYEEYLVTLCKDLQHVIDIEFMRQLWDCFYWPEEYVI